MCASGLVNIASKHGPLYTKVHNRQDIVACWGAGCWQLSLPSISITFDRACTPDLHYNQPTHVQKQPPVQTTPCTPPESYTSHKDCTNFPTHTRHCGQAEQAA